MRKIAILKMYAGDYEVEDELRHTLNHQHSFVNLQCYGIFQFYRGNIELALTMLKEAFAMNQSHYHVNRIIFFCLFKLNKHK